MPDSYERVLLHKFYDLYTLTPEVSCFHCKHCLAHQFLREAKKKFIHKRDCARTENITDYPWMHYTFLLNLNISSLSTLRGIDKLYAELMLAEHKFCEALLREFGDKAIEYRYDFSKHTPSIKRLRLIKVEAYETFSTYLKSNQEKVDGREHHEA